MCVGKKTEASFSEQEPVVLMLPEFEGGKKSESKGDRYE
jgi:hypothetical protein